MPPPKSSLGRGLGELMGGLPDTLGVAKHPPVETPATPPVATTPETSPEPGPAEVASAPRPEPVEVQPQSVLPPPPWLTPARLILLVFSSILILLVGVGVGFFVWHAHVAPVAALPPPVAGPRVVIITNTVVVSQPVTTVQPRPGVDADEFRALEAEGRLVAVDSNGVVRLIFAEPVFSSRLNRDPDQEALLAQVGGILARHGGDWRVLITGHTDATPLKTGGVCRDNHELGLARAVDVMRYFSRESQVPMAMMQAASTGEDQPPFPGDDAASRRRNRTVTLSIRPAPPAPAE